MEVGNSNDVYEKEEIGSTIETGNVLLLDFNIVEVVVAKVGRTDGRRRIWDDDYVLHIEMVDSYVHVFEKAPV